MVLNRCTSDAHINATAVAKDIMEWLTSADVLGFLENDGVDVREWIAGVNALREKAL